MKSILLSTILFLVPLATCHFKLEHPPSRAGDDDEKQATFPCGGFDTPSKERTQFPLTGGSVQLELGHDRSLVQVLLALGNDPGDSFNLVWKPTVQEEGPGEFCFPDLNVPASLNLKDGQNATIQVVTDSHDGKGLYNCADITFTNATLSGTPPPCNNGTGLRASLFEGDFTNANGTNALAANDDADAGKNNNDTTTSSPDAPSPESPAASTPSPAASTVPGAAGKVEGGVWALLGAVVVGALALL